MDWPVPRILSHGLAATLLLAGVAARADPVAQPVQGGPAGDSPPCLTRRAETSPGSRFALFAEGRSFSLVRQGILFDLEGGASVRLRARLALVGSYRMLGYDYAIGARSLDSQLAGAFFGLKLGF